MKTIRAIPKRIFDANFSDEQFKQHNHVAFISILDDDNEEKKYDTTIENFLQVRMCDIEEDIIENGKIIHTAASDAELRRIVEFVNRHKDKTQFIVHCSAGVSRSGAVATFIREKFIDEVDKERFLRENNILPNLYILNKLKEIDAV